MQSNSRGLLCNKAEDASHLPSTLLQVPRVMASYLSFCAFGRRIVVASGETALLILASLPVPA
jgi:hypothetical protein